ncbi:MAG: 23S rRNA (uracil(1939)-C(5))-methyltransferase RlmD [Anaerolineae bacterium]|nr:23S rRNA (uracil(1939)-C(5))-methyltransferase RlmD [Anaerolineae bacterium]
MAGVIELQLTAMAHGGAALGRYKGQTIFVPHTIPGERVRAELIESHAHWARARLLEVLDASPDRITPPCPYFGPDRCGGCHFQHIRYEAQVDFKRRVVIDQLGRIGGLADASVQEAIGAAEPWRYRNHVQFSLTEDGRAAFQRAGSHEPIPVDSCLIIDPLLDDLWAALDMDWPQLRQLALRCGSATGDLMAIFELDHYEDFDIEVDFPVSCVVRLADGEPVVLMGNSYLVERVAGCDYRVSAGSFFQVNTAGAEVLIDLVREHLAPTGVETLVDLYCGVGLFGLALAGQVGQVIGVEADRSAADDFRHNTQGLSNVRLIAGSVEEALPHIEGPLREGLVVLDPPRAGAGAWVMAEIARLEPRRIAYVACDPATLARDARRLVEAGYHLVEVQPVDLFPQTYHVESVALFVR